MKKMLLGCLLIASVLTNAQQDSSLVRFIQPAGVPAKGYSNVAKIDLGNCYMIIVSGQVALDHKGQLVGKDNLSQQTEQVFLNIKNALADAGATMQHIVKLGYYLLDATKVQQVRDVRDKYIHTKQPPTSTLVQVSRLFRDDLLVEIEATAVIRKE